MSSCVTAPANDEQTHNETFRKKQSEQQSLKTPKTKLRNTSLSLSQKPTIFKTQNYRMHIVLTFFKNPRTFLAPEQEEKDKEAPKRIWTPVGTSCDQTRDERIR
jgi:hypothetical protein